jgi:hypothetical protein
MPFKCDVFMNDWNVTASPVYDFGVERNTPMEHSQMSSLISESSRSTNPSFDLCIMLFDQASCWGNPHCSCLM